MRQGPVLRSPPGERQARLAFTSFLPGDGYINEYTVTVNADGLVATASVISTPDGHGLPDFIQQLSDDFRGWAGTRSWRSLESQLQVDATWHTGGHVALQFHLTPSVYDKWTVGVEFTPEAGEELQTLGRELAAFMTE